MEKFEKTETRDVSPEKEELAMERCLWETDRRVLDDIERRFGSYIPKSRLELVRKQPVHFLRHQEYQEHLRKNGIEVKENVNTLGDIHRNEACVDQEHVLVPKTLAHERIHQLSDNLYGSMLGNRMNEGTTEYLASKIRGDLHLINVGHCYPEETRIVEMISARVGDDTIGKAYFQGDWVGLKSRVDEQLGDGALAEISRLTEQRKYEEAKEVIKGR